MLKLSCLAVIAVIGPVTFHVAVAQTPAPIERVRPALLLKADDVPMRPGSPAVSVTRQQPPVPNGKQAAAMDAKQPTRAAGITGPTLATAAVAPARADTPRIEVSAARYASLALPSRPHTGPSAAGPVADASQAAVRGNKLKALPTGAVARSGVTSAFAALPTGSAPALRARSPAAERKAMRNLPKNALVPKSGRRPG
jgi:hypothetical protein